MSDLTATEHRPTHRANGLPGPSRRAVLLATGGALAAFAAPPALAAPPHRTPALPVARPIAPTLSEPLNVLFARLAARVDEATMSERSRRWLAWEGSIAPSVWQRRWRRKPPCGLLVHPSLEAALPRALDGAAREGWWSHFWGTDQPPLLDDPNLVALVTLREVAETAAFLHHSYIHSERIGWSSGDDPVPREPPTLAVVRDYRTSIGRDRPVRMVHVLPADRGDVGRHGLVTILTAPDVALASLPDVPGPCDDADRRSGRIVWARGIRDFVTLLSIRIGVNIGVS